MSSEAENLEAIKKPPCTSSQTARSLRRTHSKSIWDECQDNQEYFSIR